MSIPKNHNLTKKKNILLCLVRFAWVFVGPRSGSKCFKLTKEREVTVSILETGSSSNLVMEVVSSTLGFKWEVVGFTVGLVQVFLLRSLKFDKSERNAGNQGGRGGREEEEEEGSRRMKEVEGRWKYWMKVGGNK